MVAVWNSDNLNGWRLAKPPEFLHGKADLGLGLLVLRFQSTISNFEFRDRWPAAKWPYRDRVAPL